MPVGHIANPDQPIKNSYINHGGTNTTVNTLGYSLCFYCRIQVALSLCYSDSWFVHGRNRTQCYPTNFVFPLISFPVILSCNLLFSWALLFPLDMCSKYFALSNSFCIAELSTDSLSFPSILVKCKQI